MRWISELGSEAPVAHLGDEEITAEVLMSAEPGTGRAGVKDESSSWEADSEERARPFMRHGILFLPRQDIPDALIEPVGRNSIFVAIASEAVPERSGCTPSELETATEGLTVEDLDIYPNPATTVGIEAPAEQLMDVVLAVPGRNRRLHGHSNEQGVLALASKAGASEFVQAAG